VDAYGAHLQRFSWRKTDPHIQLQVNVAGLLTTSSEAFLADLQTAVGGTTHVNKQAIFHHVSGDRWSPER
jgi:hypothetical protein